VDLWGGVSSLCGQASRALCAGRYRLFLTNEGPRGMEMRRIVFVEVGLTGFVEMGRTVFGA